jgi:hypothetical protein
MGSATVGSLAPSGPTAAPAASPLRAGFWSFGRGTSCDTANGFSWKPRQQKTLLTRLKEIFLQMVRGQF